MYDRFGPFKGMCFGIVSLDKAINRFAQLPDRSEAGTPQGAATENAKPALHLIEPAGSGGSVMEMDVGVTSQPPVPFRFVRVQIV